ncbi:type II toxin-antitoxin system TacA family antitoxin [Leeia aquatica]|uniref:DUF1778 domain-containing protein n=1 Tax=Leeia aquatica TaxID=2725557 RepID=A0A847RV17_9NEIS|nr:DUF1778 domain-containing protein [Leeia aquatica]NLR73681.1 DUF1778 domain-containing protein [Leeia aquatica]
MPAKLTTVRLQARISTGLHTMLKRAAELQGLTINDFIVAAVHDAAKNAIEHTDIIRLSLADQLCFAQALLSPPDQAGPLRHALVCRDKLLSNE